MTGGRCENSRYLCSGSYVYRCSSCGKELAVCDKCDYCQVCQTERYPERD